MFLTRLTLQLPAQFPISRLSSARNLFTASTKMSETQQAIDKAQSRAQGAAKSDTEYDEDHGDLHQTAQKVSSEHSAQHGSEMKQAAENKQSETQGTVGDKSGNAKDQIQGVESSSS